VNFTVGFVIDAGYSQRLIIASPTDIRLNTPDSPSPGGASARPRTTMNRSVTLVGVGIFLFTIILISLPIVLTGHETFDLYQESGLIGMPVGLLIVLFGAAGADPRVTTVGGAFGNPDENLVRRHVGADTPANSARFMPGPREAVNCRYCYTAIPSGAAVCPRCARPRECRSCGRALVLLGSAIRCPQCRRNEVYCNCPKLRQTTIGGTGRVQRRY
jgi:hypothetical protein